MSQVAKVVEKRGSKSPNGWTRIIEIHSGEKGQGQQIGKTIEYWPWSPRSEEQAYDIVAEIAKSNDLELVYDKE